MLSLVGKELSLDKLKYFIAEREEIRIKRHLGKPAPWTKDPILANYYFCNIRREDDKVTKWIRANYPNSQDIASQLVLARCVNKIETLEKLVGTPVHHFRAIQTILEGIDHPWGNAYLFVTNGRRMGKAVYLCQIVLPAAYAALQGTSWVYPMVGQPPTLAHAYRALKTVQGLGSFMAGQVIADLKNTRGHPLEVAKDWSTWSSPGPGSLRGLAWIFGESSPTLYYEQIAWVQRYLKEADCGAPCENMQDIQNCMCEFDKYMRGLNGQKLKRRYP